MIKRKKIFAAFLSVIFLGGCTEPPIVDVPPDPGPQPFCNLAAVADTVLIPTNVSREQFAEDIGRLYRDLRNNSLRSVVNGTYAFFAAGGTGVNGSRALTNSETHGYGMLILVLAYEMGAPVAFGDERDIFDRMNALRKVQGSATPALQTGSVNNLMSWVIHGSLEADTVITEAEVRSCWNDRLECWTEGDDINHRPNNPNPPAPAQFGRSSSATDGDMDMAYALLLAHRIWGSSHYLDDARAIIGSIKDLTFHRSQARHRTNLGDWHGRWPTSLRDTTTSRSSDWMPGHFRAFYRATNDDFWLSAIDTLYSLLGRVSHPATGLMPDFIIDIPARVVANEYEAQVAGEHNFYNYSFNACRVPWRIALDWVHYSEPRAKRVINKISCWLREATLGIPTEIRSGYTLAGESFGTGNSLAFVGPFTSGMLGDANNQAFLNASYTSLATRGSGGFYNDALRLLNLFLITDNWRAPL